MHDTTRRPINRGLNQYRLFTEQACFVQLLIRLNEAGANKVDEFFPRGGVIEESTCKSGSCSNRILFLYTPHYHAQMLCLDDHGYPKWFEVAFNTISYLHGQPFLYL